MLIIRWENALVTDTNTDINPGFFTRTLRYSGKLIANSLSLPAQILSLGLAITCSMVNLTFSAQKYNRINFKIKVGSQIAKCHLVASIILFPLTIISLLTSYLTHKDNRLANANAIISSSKLSDWIYLNQQSQDIIKLCQDKKYDECKHAFNYAIDDFTPLMIDQFACYLVKNEPNCINLELDNYSKSVDFIREVINIFKKKIQVDQWNQHYEIQYYITNVLLTQDFFNDENIDMIREIIDLYENYIPASPPAEIPTRFHLNNIKNENNKKLILNWFVKDPYYEIKICGSSISYRYFVSNFLIS